MSTPPVPGPVVTREDLAEATPSKGTPAEPVVVDWYPTDTVAHQSARTTVLRSSRTLGAITARPAPTVNHALDLARSTGPQGLAYLPALRSRSALGATLAVSRLLKTIPPRTLNHHAHPTPRTHAPLISPTPTQLPRGVNAVWFPHLLTIGHREAVMWELMRHDQHRAWAGTAPREMPAGDLVALLPALLRLRTLSRAHQLAELGADGREADVLLSVHPLTVPLVWRHPALFRRLALRIARSADPTA